MSRSTLKLIQMPISKSGDNTELITDLFNLFDFDGDFKGENGKEHTSQTALDLGYESDLSMSIETSLKEHGSNLELIIESIAAEAFRNTDYYSSYSVKFYHSKEQLVVAIAYSVDQ
ncbi:hypothetical protein [Bacillus toyonensis]|uniref:hypothetical protein n=1 Tax=Bacillus toyonensis TaxID=155322 RepID=UPI002E2256EE|nr:hypothetical protein [Bacillus toyonensis]